MSKLIGIGELLIDFISNDICLLKDSKSFTKYPGGAPANVSVCASRLGVESTYITKLGMDSFGDYLLEVLRKENVNTDFIKRTSKANTGLAFVSLDKNGERSFSFYRNPSSDLFLSSDEIDELLFKENDILHFCSVDLVDYPVRYAHKKAIECALNNNCIVSFDPNLRFSLWNDLNDLKRTVNEYINYAHILKISEDELEFICDNNIEALFRGNVLIVIITRGEKGSEVWIDKKLTYKHEGYKVKAIDTTGAGDSFIGSFLAQLIKKSISVDMLKSINYQDILAYSNKVSSIVVGKYGAMSSMPYLDEVDFK